MIDVCVVDDSATVRRLISTLIDKQPDLNVKGTAASAEEAQALIRKEDFDVMTLDVVMPGKNGLDFLNDLADEGKEDMSTIIISALAQKDSEVESVAYSRGADSCIFKPKSKEDMVKFELQLGAAIRTAVKKRVKTAPAASRVPVGTAAKATGTVDLIAIAASTGGIPATEAVLSHLKPTTPPVIVTQHLRADALETLATRMNSRRTQEVALARDGEILQPGTVRYAPPGHHLTVVNSGGRLMVRNVPAKEDEAIVPCADPMFLSVSSAVKHRAIGIVLTGMGTDGAEGLLAMRKAGAQCYGEAEASCVVYGMPKAAMRLGAVEHEMTNDEIGRALVKV